MYQALTTYTPKLFKAEDCASLKPVHYWKYDYIVSTIILHQLRQKKKFESTISLDSKILKKLLGERYYLPIILDLIEGGVINRINYRENIHSYLFKLSHQTINDLRSGIKRKTLEKKSITRKIHLLRDQHLSEMLKDVNFQHEFQMMTSLRLDVEAAMQYINANYKQDSLQWISRSIAIQEFDKMKDVSFSDGMYLLDFMYKKDSSGRIHSPNSHFPSDLRKFIRDSSGQKMTEIDQACSQLTYAHKFCLEFSHDKVNKTVVKSQHIGEEIPDETHQSNKIGFSKSVWKTASGEYGAAMIPSYVLTIDKVWKEAIFSGKGYNILMDALEYKGTKDEFKEQFFSQLFFNKYRTQLTKMEKVFEHYFPNEFKRLRTAKKALGNRGLSIQVQRQEAYFWHHKVNQMMRSKYPLVVYGNVHDSILAPEDQAEQIRNDIAELLKTHFNGIDALVRIKPCN